jgi:hypothetical protein
MPSECLAKHSPGGPATREAHFFYAFFFIFAARPAFYFLKSFVPKGYKKKRQAKLKKKA